MSALRFAIGQSVSVAYSKRYPRPAGLYQVVGFMPRAGGATQYRIKGELEKFERIIDEMYLAAA
jgi:hypothetical protein